MVDAPNVFDLNAAFGKALLDKFFEPVLSGQGPDGVPYYSPSGIGVLAQQIYTAHAIKIKDAVWNQIDLDDFAKMIADKVVADLMREPDRWAFGSNRNPHREELIKRVLEVVAEQLGQRVVDQLDLQLGPKAIEASTDG